MGEIMNICLLNLEEMKRELLKLREVEFKSYGTLSPYQIFIHCAKTIEYSMIGYPKMSPTIVRNTIGKVRIKKRLKRQKMKHKLDTDVPGSTVTPDDGSTDEGIEMLLEMIHKFQNFKGTLQPHYQFGNLTKEQYASYFCIHIRNHLLGLEEVK